MRQMANRATGRTSHRTTIDTLPTHRPICLRRRRLPHLLSTSPRLYRRPLFTNYTSEIDNPTRLAPAAPAPEAGNWEEIPLLTAHFAACWKILVFST